MPCGGRSACFAVMLLAGGVVLAQQSYDPYDQIYGPPADVPLAELAQGAVAFTGRPIRTVGYLDLYLAPGATTRYYTLREGGFSILLTPRPELAQDWEFEAMRMLGQRLQVVGFYQESQAFMASAGPSGVLEFWKYMVVSRDDDEAARAKAREVTLQALVRSPDRHEGELVRVRGEFRGRNLFGDVPASTQRAPADWVLRDDVFAVWVTGRAPRGSGWRLDPTLQRDSGKWLEVVGRVQVWKGAVYLRAAAVELASKPVLPVATNAPPLPERPRRPPVIVFSLPLDREAEVSADARFTVQFSNDMDASTFAGRVTMRYVGLDARATPPFPRLSTSYDAGRRAMTVDPGDRLRPGRLELLLLPGIKDVEGLELVPRQQPDGPGGGAAEILRFSVVP